MLIDVRKIADRIRRAGALVTSVLSSMLKVVSPQWTKAEATWDGWTLTKRVIAGCVIGILALTAWKFSLDVTRLVSGSYRSAYAYGHGQNLTKSDISGMAHMSDISSLQRQIDALKSQLSSVRDMTEKEQASKITTGSIQQSKKKRR